MFAFLNQKTGKKIIVDEKTAREISVNPIYKTMPNSKPRNKKNADEDEGKNADEEKSEIEDD